MQSWFPENVSTFGADVDGIFWFIFYIVTIWFFLTEGLILYLSTQTRAEGSLRRGRYLGATGLGSRADGDRGRARLIH